MNFFWPFGKWFLEILHIFSNCVIFFILNINWLSEVQKSILYIWSNFMSGEEIIFHIFLPLNSIIYLYSFSISAPHHRNPHSNFLQKICKKYFTGKKQWALNLTKDPWLLSLKVQQLSLLLNSKVKISGTLCLISTALCVVVTVTTTVVHMNRLQTLRECVYQVDYTNYPRHLATTVINGHYLPGSNPDVHLLRRNRGPGDPWR